jgi:hypothetical protein
VPVKNAGQLVDLGCKHYAGRSTALIDAWAAIDVSVFPLASDDRQQLLGNLKRGAWSADEPREFNAALTNFANPMDFVVIVGWDIGQDPAVLLPASAVAGAKSHLQELYPRGFLLTDPTFSSALVAVLRDNLDENARRSG